MAGQPEGNLTASEAGQQLADMMSDEQLDELVDDAELSEEIEEEVEEPTDEALDAEEVEDEDSEDAEPDEEEEEQVELETLADVAEALGVEESELLDNLKTAVKVDGEENPVTLAELRAGYQKDADYRRKTAEVAEIRKALDAQSEQHRQEQAAAHTFFADVLSQAEALIAGEWNDAEMAALRVSNPQEYLIRESEQRKRIERLQQIRARASQNLTQAQEQFQTKTSEQLKVAREQMVERVSEAIDWNGETDAQLTQYLLKQGYSEQQLTSLTDPFAVINAYKAMKYDESQKKVDVAKKKVSKAPKRQPSAKPEGKVRVKRSQLSKAVTKAKKSGDLRDAAKALELAM